MTRLFRRLGAFIPLTAIVACGAGGSPSAPGDGQDPDGGEVMPGPAPAPTSSDRMYIGIAYPQQVKGARYVWLVDSKGNKHKLEGVQGLDPRLTRYEGELWLQSWELVTPDSYVIERYRQRVMDTELGPAEPDFFPEVVAPSADRSMAVSVQQGIRLYDINQPTPQVVSSEGDSPWWLPGDNGFIYYRQLPEDRAYEIYRVPVRGGVAGAPQLLIPRAWKSLQYSPDGRWLLLRSFPPGVEDEGKASVVLFDAQRGYATQFEVAAPAEGRLDAYLCGGFVVFQQSTVEVVPPVYALSYQAVDGSARVTMDFAPDARVHQTEFGSPWLTIGADSPSALVELTPAGPSIHPVNGVYPTFSPNAKRVFTGQWGEGRKGAQWLLNTGGGLEPLWTFPADGFATMTFDYAQAVIGQPDGVYSLRVEAGQTPVRLADVPEGDFLPSYSDDKAVILQARSATGVAFSIIDWPDGAPRVANFEFEEPNLRLNGEFPLH